MREAILAVAFLISVGFCTFSPRHDYHNVWAFCEQESLGLLRERPEQHFSTRRRPNFYGRLRCGKNNVLLG